MRAIAGTPVVTGSAPPLHCSAPAADSNEDINKANLDLYYVVTM